MRHRPWYARLLHALDRWSARVLEEREYRRQTRTLPSYDELKARPAAAREANAKEPSDTARQLYECALAEKMDDDQRRWIERYVASLRARLAESERPLDEVRFALESYVDTDMAHDDPARAVRVLCEIVDHLTSVTLTPPEPT